MRRRPALTLVEFIIVTGFVALIGTGCALAFNNFRQKQALTLAVQEFSDVLRKAHIFARSEKEEAAWMVKRLNSTTYVLVSGTKALNIERETHKTENPVYISTNSFELWFARGTGEAEKADVVQLTTPGGFSKTIEISKSGIVRSY